MAKYLPLVNSSQKILVDDDIAKQYASLRLRIAKRDENSHPTIMLAYYRAGAGVSTFARVILGITARGGRVNFKNGNRLDLRRDNMEFCPFTNKTQRSPYKANLEDNDKLRFFRHIDRIARLKEAMAREGLVARG